MKKRRNRKRKAKDKIMIICTRSMAETTRPLAIYFFFGGFFSLKCFSIKEYEYNLCLTRKTEPIKSLFDYLAE